MEENKQQEAKMPAEENQAAAPVVNAPKEEAPKRPTTIEEMEKKEHQEKGVTTARELQRRQEIDPDKSAEEIKKEFEAKSEEQKKIDAGKPESLAHQADPGLPTSKN